MSKHRIKKRRNICKANKNGDAPRKMFIFNYKITFRSHYFKSKESKSYMLSLVTGTESDPENFLHVIQRIFKETWRKLMSEISNFCMHWIFCNEIIKNP